MSIPMLGSVAWEVFYGKAHYHTLCWKLSLAQTTDVFYWTEYGHPLVLFDDKTYSPIYGANSTAKEERGQGETGNKQLEGFLVPQAEGAGLGLTGDDIKRGALRGARLEEYLIDHRTPWLAPIDIKSYFVTGAHFDGMTWKIEVEGLAYPLKDIVGEHWGPSCRSKLFDRGIGKCNADILQYTGFTVVSAVVNQGYQFQVNLALLPAAFAVDHYASDGRILFNGGNNTSGRYNIREWRIVTPGTTAEFTLHQRTVRDVAAGDGLTVYPGCNKWLDDCFNKFNNIENYQGEPFIPGRDRTTAGQRSPV